MVRTRFGASDFCRLTGISAETLRHYAECGIIDTVDIETNNYKKYSAKNAMDVLHARMCRGLEIPIPNIILKAGGSLDEQESLMRRHEAVLQIEARQLSLKLERMRQALHVSGNGPWPALLLHGELLYKIST
ncbi:MAG: MerR family transcriptional regulator [Treponemataceae bacterium]